MVIPIGFSSLKCLFGMFIVAQFPGSKCKSRYNLFVFIHCILFTSRQGYGCPTKSLSKSLSHSSFAWRASAFHPYAQNAICWKKRSIPFTFFDQSVGLLRRSLSIHTQRKQQSGGISEKDSLSSRFVQSISNLSIFLCTQEQASLKKKRASRYD